MSMFDNDDSDSPGLGYTPNNPLASLGNYGGYGGSSNANGLVGNGLSALGNAGAGGTDGGLFSMQSFLGGKGQQGWGLPAIAGGASLLQGLLGMQQYGLAQDQFKESKRQYNQNYAAQRQSINTQLEDRQRARVASNPGAYQSVSDYLDKNKVV